MFIPTIFKDDKAPIQLISLFKITYMATSYSLYELNEYIKRVVALNFEEAIWVRCEVSQASHSRGSVYLNVVELDQESDNIIAQAQAVIWPRSYIFLQNKLKQLLPFMLEAGSEVLIKIKVDFHERYGLKLVVEDIDPSYTLGQAEMARQKIIERLKSERLLELNDHRKLPAVLQSIAVISSETAAGYADFIAQIENNIYGYDIRPQLFNAAVQGRNVERDVVDAFREIQTNGKHYDAVIIIRGGGSKLDLAGFDNYNIGHAIAMCRYPVIIGIGHEVDTTVTDLVAQVSLKTPTAVASFIIDKNLEYESELLESASQVQNISLHVVRDSNAQIEHLEYIMKQTASEKVYTQKYELDHSLETIKIGAYNMIQRHDQYLNNTESLIGIVDPIKTLKRGFSIIKQNGKAVESIKDIDVKKELEIVMKDGSKKFKN